MSEFLIFVAIGFCAQLIDGAIGMAYGLTSTSVLLSFGIPPATASASVHAAEVFTTGASAVSHWRFRNVRLDLVLKLAVPGVIGGVTGAFVLANVDGQAFRPFIAAYLAVMGIWIIAKALKARQTVHREPRFVGALGLFGGFLDAIGGGGWGPIVTTSMVGQGAEPRKAIGSTNAAEFLVTLSISGTFFIAIGLELWPIILGLIVGGVVAAPIAAFAVSRVPDRPMMAMVGALITILAAREIALAVGF